MRIKVKVIVDAKRESIVEKSSATFLISVREPREENRANSRIRELLAQHYGVKVTAVRIIFGHHSTSKHISITK